MWTRILHAKMAGAYQKYGHVIKQMIVEITVMKVQLMVLCVVSVIVECIAIFPIAPPGC